MTREEVLDVIERAARERATELDLRRRGITELPEEIGQLGSLQVLDLRYNRLMDLPAAIGQLANLKTLRLEHNQLTALPEAIRQLASLQSLLLEDNQLTVVPDAVAHLANLYALLLGRNQLTGLPEAIGQLASLRQLWLTGNRLTSLPKSLARPENLFDLRLDGNPLQPALKAAYRAGLDEVKAYLRSLEEETEELYEAKLLLVGEGDVGKTTLMKAMTKRKPREGEPTTHGVNIDIHSLRVPHPEKGAVEIRLNAWDFGGQEVYRVTHQFFFSRRSIYIVVWEPRRGVSECQVEEWLEMIRLRVGDDARIIIVSTHCRTGERIARIDRPVLREKYGEMIVGFCEVDSLVPDETTGEMVGVKELKELIAETASGLEHVGMEFNRDWLAARDQLLEREEPRIPYEEFARVCADHGLDEISTKTLADLMHDLGYIVYYSEDERLKGDVVLQPQWLTKAIGFVLEDRTTQEMDGILPDGRLRAVWRDHPFKGETRYDPELYPFFLRLMQRYDVSYRLDEAKASLVAQHVPQERPENLPWLPGKPVRMGEGRIAMVCELDEEPPGLVPWMIVRTHRYSCELPDAGGTVHRLHWQRGMFLEKDTHGEGLLELGEDEFRIYVEAVWPAYFMSELQQTLQKLLTDNWPGMEGRYRFTVPCKGPGDGKACRGRFSIDALQGFLDRGHPGFPCQYCQTDQPIVELLFGFEREDPREQFGRLEEAIDRKAAVLDRELRKLRSQLAQYTMGIMQAVGSESKHGPRFFTVEPVDGNWRRFVGKRYRLRLWCEHEARRHPVCRKDKGKGVYEFKATEEWVKRVAPYANLVARILRTGVSVAVAGAGALSGDATVAGLGMAEYLDCVKALTGQHLTGELEILDRSRLREGGLDEAERSGVLALHAFLREEDRHHERLGLHRVATYTGDFLWLCDRHYEEWEPRIPDVIDGEATENTERGKEKGEKGRREAGGSG